MQISVIGDTVTGVSEPGQQSFSVCLGNGMHGKDILDLCCVALGRCEQMSAYPDRDTMTDKVRIPSKFNIVSWRVLFGLFTRPEMI